MRFLSIPTERQKKASIDSKRREASLAQSHSRPRTPKQYGCIKTPYFINVPVTLGHPGIVMHECHPLIHPI
jgi:hypothetical protein